MELLVTLRNLLGNYESIETWYYLIAPLIAGSAGLILFALFLFSAISMKKSRTLGLMTAVAQPLALLAPVLASTIGNVYFHYVSFNLIYDIYKSANHASGFDVEQFLSLLELNGTTFVSSAAEMILPDLIIGTVFLITLIYLITLLKNKGKVFPIIAIILLVFAWLSTALIKVIPYVGINCTVLQSLWLLVYVSLHLVIALLIAIQGLINLIAWVKNRKVAKAAKAGSDKTPCSEDKDRISDKETSDPNYEWDFDWSYDDREVSV